MHIRVTSKVCLLLLGCLVVGFSTEARAQSGHKWTVEAHVGTLSGSDSVTGVPTLPPLGETFGSSGSPGRRVSSWFFGDGSQQLNDFAAPRTSRRPIVALDSLLGRSVGPSGGVSFGGRLARELTPRLQLEIAVEFAPSRFELDDDLLSQVERTRVSFEEAFTDFFGLPAFGRIYTVTSQMSVGEESSHQLDTGVVATFDLAVWRRLIPFVSGGGGWSSTLGDEPSLTLSGNYVVQITPTAVSFDETDNVTLRFEPKSSRPFADLGGGVRVPLSPRSGLRVDVRARIQSEGMRTKVSANPVLVARSPSSSAATFGIGDTNIRFSTVNPYSNSTLSIVDLANFETFSSSETRAHLNASVGWFWRF